MEHGINTINGNDILEYCASAIRGREWGKFIFTKTVSLILEIVASYGEQNGLSRDEMSHIPIDELMALSANSNSNYSTVEEYLRDISNKNLDKHSITSAIRLPQVIVDSDAAFIVPFQVSLPNFITNKSYELK